jgi:hypothetical protein
MSGEVDYVPALLQFNFDSGSRHFPTSQDHRLDVVPFENCPELHDLVVYSGDGGERA